MNPCPDLLAWEELAADRCDSARAEILHQHLHGCPACSTTFADLKRNARLLGALKCAWRPRPGLSTSMIGIKVGKYEITGFLGAGGMANVYLARQSQPHRTVALKLMKLGMESREAARRFDQEAEVLGRLQHPGIAHIYEAGVAELGGRPQPYFAMELIEGSRLTQYASEQSLSTHGRLDLIAAIGEAVHYAHQKGIIHRDLKPSNILVDRSGQPKILDFGVARATDADVQVTTMHTDIGQLIGTIPYMSPEQASGDPRELDVRSDVYSLGVVCYELLAGTLPYAVKDKTVPQAVRVIQEDDPVPLSSVSRMFRGDLETIVAKALEKDKDRRYPSMSAFVADIRRYLSDEPIAARPPSAAYQLAKFARRNRILVGGVAAVFLALVLGLLGTGYGLWTATAARHRAVESERAELARRLEAETVIQLLTDMLGAANPHRVKGNDYTVRQLLDDFSQSLDDRLEDQPEVTATIHAAIGNAYRGLGVRPATQHHLKAALEIRRTTLGEKHPLFAQSLYDYGWYLHDHADYPGAEQVFRECLGLRRELLGNEHKDVAATLTALADMLRHNGKLDEAEPLAREGLAINQKLLGDRNLNVAHSHEFLGMVLRDKGDFEQAEAHMRQTLEIMRNIHGPVHADIAHVLPEFARLLQSGGKTTLAAETFDEALSMSRKTLGENHHNVGVISTYYGELLRDQGEMERAEPLLRQGVVMGKAAHGDTHVCTAWQKNALAICLRFAGANDEAEVLYREALAAYVQVEGEQSVTTNVIKVNLADVLIEQGNLSEARELAGQALTAHRARLGDKHVHTANAMHTLGLSLVLDGDAIQAEPLLRESLAVFQDLPLAPAWQVARAQSRLGLSLISLKQFDEAQSLLAQGLETLRSQKGDQFPETRATRARMELLQTARGNASAPPQTLIALPSKPATKDPVQQP